MMRRANLLSLAICALFFVSGAAGAVEIGDDFNISGAGNIPRGHSSSADLGGHGFVVVWQSDEHAGGLATYGQLFDESGKKLGKQFRISRRGAAPGIRASVSGLANGGFVVMWTTGSDHGSRRIKGKIYTDLITLRPIKVSVSRHLAGDHSAPSVAGLSTGKFVVTWSRIAPGDERKVMARRFSPRGRPKGKVIQVESDDLDWSERSPSVSALPDGQFVIAYEQGRGAWKWNVKAQVFASNGTAGATFKLNSKRGNGNYRPDVAGLDDGGFVVAWISPHELPDLKHRYVRTLGRVIGKSGTGDSSEFEVFDYYNKDGGPIDPKVAALPNGRFVAVWASAEICNRCDKYNKIYGQYFLNSSERLGEKFEITDTPLWEAYDSYAAPLRDGKYLVTWTQGHDPDARSPHRILGRLLEAP